MSGGHTFLVEMRDHLAYRLLGETVDDAAGEAFDKAGRLLGLGYPGGPAIAAGGGGRRWAAPSGCPRAWLAGTYDFSFSGLKTALRRLVEVRAGRGRACPRPRRAGGSRRTAWRRWPAAFQESVVDVLATKTLRAAAETGARAIVVGGGVASNAALRARLAAGAAGPRRGRS